MQGMLRLKADFKVKRLTIRLYKTTACDLSHRPALLMCRTILMHVDEA